MIRFALGFRGLSVMLVAGLFIGASTESFAADPSAQPGACDRLIAQYLSGEWEGLEDRIEQHGWTLTEDQSIRDATKAFAIANMRVLYTGGPAKLANGLLISFGSSGSCVGSERSGIRVIGFWRHGSGVRKGRF